MTYFLKKEVTYSCNLFELPLIVSLSDRTGVYAAVDANELLQMGQWVKE